MASTEFPTIEFEIGSFWPDEKLKQVIIAQKSSYAHEAVMPTLHIASIISCSKATVRWKVENGVIIGHRNVNNHHIHINYIIKLAPFEVFLGDWFILSGMTRPIGYSYHKFNSIFTNESATYNSQIQIIKWGVSFQWSASLYCPMRNSDQITIEKTDPT